jgi:tetratricopeptide (TPR) repeat protein
MGGKSGGPRQHLLFCFACVTFGSGCGLFGAPSVPGPKPLPPPVIIEPLPPPPVIIEPLPPPPPPPPPPPVELKETRELREADAFLQSAQQLLSKGDYESSFKESQKVLALAKENAPADAAMFHMGLIYAHPNNPKKNNKTAIGFFTRVIKSYPESPWVEQAKIWVGVLDGLEKLKQVDIEIEEKKRDRTR